MNSEPPAPAHAATSRRVIVSGPPGAGVVRALAQRLAAHLDAGLDPERVLALAADRRAARSLATELRRAGVYVARPLGYLAFAQELLTRHWPLVRAQLGIEQEQPRFLAFDLAQYACREEYRAAPGQLARLTIREPRLIVQLLDNMNLAAANGLSLEEAWARVAAGLGVAAHDPIIGDGLRITTDFRARCIRGGVLPFDLQIEMACRLLAEPLVREQVLRHDDLLLLDGLDEFVPAMIHALVPLAQEMPQALVGHSTDGGLRWMLGASARVAGEVGRDLAAGGSFRAEHLPGADPHGRLAQAARIAEALGGETEPATHHAPDGWSLTVTPRPDQMARAVVVEVLAWLDAGIEPQEIVLLTPYIDPIVTGELLRTFADADVPFRVEHRWRSLFDDAATRACLTALRLAAEEPQRPASLVEVADLLVTLLDVNPVAVQRIANICYDSEAGTLRTTAGIARRAAEAGGDPLPEGALRLAGWVERSWDGEALDLRLERFAAEVLPTAGPAHALELRSACAVLAEVVRRFVDGAPRLGVDPPYLDAFLAFVDSGIIAADDPPDTDEPAVTLTTPYAFLTTGRVVGRQAWLDVGSPNWWEPPLLLLTNPHALGDDAGALPFTLEHEERVRARVLGRVLRNLAARVEGEISTFAARTGPDGEPLAGPLLLALRAAGVREEPE